MNDPARSGRDFFDELVRRIPGFRGYYAAKDRQESDRQERDYLVQRLQECKRGLNAFAARAVDGGQLDALPRFERLTDKLDRLVGRIRGSVQRHAWFSSDEADARLDALYDHDLALTQLVEQLQTAVGQLPEDAAKVPPAWGEILKKLEEIDSRWTAREETLTAKTVL